MNNSELQFGCEFELYVGEHNEEELKEELNKLCNNELHINLAEDSLDNIDSLMNYKKDSSLVYPSGREISTPICSYNDLKQFIIGIIGLVQKFGKTNNYTGLHIHMSFIDKSGNIDFFRFMLLCEYHNLLDNWGDRNKYSMNIMNVLSYLDREEAEKIKDRKGRVWSLEKRDNHYVEIRTMGGDKYEDKQEQIFTELDKFIDIFKESSLKPTEDYLQILTKHQELLANCDPKKREEFLIAIAEFC